VEVWGQLVDEQYWERFYEANGTLGYSYNSIYNEVRTDPAFQIYQSASAKIKLMAGQTGLLYQVRRNPMRGVTFCKVARWDGC
jgi:hypothetical protein